MASKFSKSKYIFYEASFQATDCAKTSGSLGNFLVQSIPYLRYPETKTAVLAQRYIKVFCTFLISAVIHAGGSLYISQKDGKFSDGGSFKGFLIQAMFIVGEDLVIWLLDAKDDGNPSASRRLIGYLLVHSYAAYAVPILKVIPLGQDHGLEVEGCQLMIGVKMAAIGAQGILRNPFATLVGSFNA